MAHHQGMSLLSLAYLLLDRPMQRRFESDPELQATLLLLQERVPQRLAFHPHTADRVDLRSGGRSCRDAAARDHHADTPAPEVQLLSNGRYHVMFTNSRRGLQPLEGPGCHTLARGRAPATIGAASATCATPRPAPSGRPRHQPTQWPADSYEAIFSEGRAEFRRRDQGIDAYTEIVVSPEDDIELRRLRITNLQPHAPQHRGHQLCGGGDGTRGGGCTAPGVQQAFRADRSAGRAAR